MLRTLKDLFTGGAGNEMQADQAGGSTNVELAAAVLMVEISMADSSRQHVEMEAMTDALQRLFGLTESRARSIVELAEREADHSVSLHEFTSLLNSMMTMQEKITVIELLWRVAYADAVLDKYEEYYIRKIADLLYVPHRDFIKAKHQAG
jgi:uncharacterized tellurite resistance protein B-like protein